MGFRKYHKVRTQGFKLEKSFKLVISNKENVIEENK